MAYQIEIPGADTMVMVSTERKYKLHSAQLIQASRGFAQLLSVPGPNLSREGLRDGTRYLLVLQDFDEATNRHIHPIFRRIPTNQHGTPTKSFSLMHDGEKKPHFRSTLFADYDRLLRIFVNQPVAFNDKSVDALLPDSLGLLEVAERLGALSMVAKLIENQLIVKGQEIFKAISASPVMWIDVAYRIQSKVLFKEALIHLTGNYNALMLTPPDEAFLKKYSRARSILDQLTPELRNLLEAKRAELKAICHSHYLPGLQKSSVTGLAKDGTIGRIDYGKDIFSWLAVTLYRHWWGLTLAAGETYQNKYGGHDMYIRLFNGGKSYLTREVQSSFHQHFPMSNRAQGVVENNLDIMKAGIVKIVTPLMKNESQLDIAMTPVKWLTCTQVKGADYLWDPEIEPEQEPEEESEEVPEQEAELGAEQGAEQEAEQTSEIQPVSEKAKGKRRAVEAPVETGPSVEPIRKKGKGRAIMPFEEEEVDAEEDGDAEYEEV
ncbi:hypothetical protein E4T50_08113 [Aureobasidium sp. EXF-12298]|nr:hypothetical protein E4T50_08113 [Aureobasidium sp. EXF-12298]